MLDYELMSIDMIRNKILASVEELTDSQINKRSSEDKWSIAQLLRHLYDSETGLTQMIKFSLEQSNTGNLERKPLFMILDRTQKGKVPEGRAPSENFTTKDELLSLLAQSRQTLLRLIDEIKGEDEVEKLAISFPKFGLLSLAQCLEFIGLHELRHFEQLNEIKLETLYVPVSP
ncbi:DinB family protein [Cytobacillus sp. Hm23]